MKKQEIARIKEELSVLIGQPLRDMFRFCGASIAAKFGELIEVEALTFAHDENGELALDENGDL